MHLLPWIVVPLLAATIAMVFLGPALGSVTIVALGILAAGTYAARFLVGDLRDGLHELRSVAHERLRRLAG